MSFIIHWRRKKIYKIFVRKYWALRLLKERANIGGKMISRYSEKIKQEARRLRKRGFSLGEIGNKLEIPKNTISGWVKDIRLTDKQKERVRQKIIASGAIGRALAVKVNHKKIKRWRKEIRDEAKYFAELAHKNIEASKLICGLLYLCEGSKYPSTKCLVFGNSDPEIIRCFINLLRTAFNINEDKLRCRIMHRYDQNLKKLNRFWSGVTGIPLQNFYRSRPDGRTKGKATSRKNYKGICAIYYLNTKLQLRLQAIGEEIVKSGAEGN